VSSSCTQIGGCSLLALVLPAFVSSLMLLLCESLLPLPGILLLLVVYTSSLALDSVTC
jgi:hypothetical protein